ncbi:MAG TPA: DsbA family protein [Thermoleophilaceae bacterium]
MEQQPVFYYDLGSPYSYLTAERVQGVLPAVPVWQPILLGGIWQQTGGQSWGLTEERGGTTEEREAGMREIERRAEEYGLMPVRWPEGWPNNTLKANRAAIFCQSIGRAVAFSQAAFRQAFAAGRDLSDTDNILIAAAACELHPNAILKALETQSVKDKLREATAEAYERGIRGVPTIAVGDELFYGDDRLEEAASALAAA